MISERSRRANPKKVDTGVEANTLRDERVDELSGIDSFRAVN